MNGSIRFTLKKVLRVWTFLIILGGLYILLQFIRALLLWYGLG